MKEKVFSISGDDFTIKTAEGQDVCICKGKAISARGKKKFLDMQENELFTLENKMLALQKSFRGVSPSGHDFEITGKFKMMGSRSICTFKNASDGRQVEIEVKGDWLDKSAEILYEDKVVASISRKFFNAREFFGGSQTVCFRSLLSRHCGQRPRLAMFLSPSC